MAIEVTILTKFKELFGDGRKSTTLLSQSVVLDYSATHIALTESVVLEYFKTSYTLIVLLSLSTMNNLLTESVVLESSIFWPREREGE